jgi:hypothetical protein
MGCPLSKPVKKDMEEFLSAMRTENVDPRALKMKGITGDEVLALLWKIYQLMDLE